MNAREHAAGGGPGGGGGGDAAAPRVVVADDQALVRAGFRMILASDGIDVVAEAVDGNEAVEAVRRTRPDVVLMDVRMPGLDGLEAMRRLRAAPATAETPVVAVSAFPVEGEARSAGATVFVAKPFDLDALVEVVGQAMG